MKRIEALIALLIVAIVDVFGQESEKLKFTAIFQSVLSVDNRSYSTSFGKTEVGLWIKPNDYLKIRMVGKLYNDFSIKPFDIYAGVIPFRNLELKIGQFRSPFCYENTIAPFDRIFIDEALTTKLLPTRDIGLGYDLYYKKLEVNFALLNGEGKNLNDLNKNKDIAIRIAIALPSDIVFGMSYYNGCSGPDSLSQFYYLYNIHILKIQKNKYSIVSEFSHINNRIIYKNIGYIAGSYKLRSRQNHLCYIEPVIRAEFLKEYLSSSKYYSTIGFNLHFDDENTLKMSANLNTELTSIQNSNFLLSLFYALK